MRKAIYLFSDGKLQRKGNTLYFESEGLKKYLPVEDVGEIFVFGEVEFNRKLVEFLSQNEIILHYFNHYGYYMGTFYPREHYNSGYMILKQAEHFSDQSKRLFLGRAVVKGSARNILQVLKYYAQRGKEVESNIETVENYLNKVVEAQEPNELLGLEGNIREVYYHAFDVILQDKTFVYEKRTRRPPQNYLNTLISFGNSLLYSAVLSEIYKTHLDPRIGFLHTTNFRSFTLNLDIAEVFKPIIVDRTIFSLIGRKEIKKEHFEKGLEGFALTTEGKKLFITEFEEKLKTTIKHPELKRDVSYRFLIRLELYKLEKHLLGEKPFEPFVSRW